MSADEKLRRYLYNFRGLLRPTHPKQSPVVYTPTQLQMMCIKDRRNFRQISIEVCALK